MLYMGRFAWPVCLPVANWQLTFKILDCHFRKIRLLIIGKFLFNNLSANVLYLFSSRRNEINLSKGLFLNPAIGSH